MYEKKQNKNEKIDNTAHTSRRRKRDTRRQMPGSRRTTNLRRHAQGTRRLE